MQLVKYIPLILYADYQIIMVAVSNQFKTSFLRYCVIEHIAENKY